MKIKSKKISPSKCFGKVRGFWDFFQKFTMEFLPV